MLSIGFYQKNPFVLFNQIQIRTPDAFYSQTVSHTNRLQATNVLLVHNSVRKRDNQTVLMGFTKIDV